MVHQRMLPLPQPRTVLVPGRLHNAGGDSGDPFIHANYHSYDYSVIMNVAHGSWGEMLVLSAHCPGSPLCGFEEGRRVVSE